PGGQPPQTPPLTGGYPPPVPPGPSAFQFLGGRDLGAPHVQRDGGGHHGGGDQEVHRHRGRVELGQHDDPADHRLCHHPERLGRAQPHQVASASAVRPVPPGRDEDQRGDDD